MTITEKMHRQIIKAEDASNLRKKYQAYHLAIIYAAKSEVMNKGEVIAQLTALREDAYEIYCN